MKTQSKRKKLLEAQKAVWYVLEDFDLLRDAAAEKGDENEVRRFLVLIEKCEDIIYQIDETDELAQQRST